MTNKDKSGAKLAAAEGAGSSDTLERQAAIYPCADCGVMRTKDEGGTVFTVCDECWEKHYAKYKAEGR